jgi:hypothetical protein
VATTDLVDQRGDRRCVRQQLVGADGVGRVERQPTTLSLDDVRTPRPTGLTFLLAFGIGYVGVS